MMNYSTKILVLLLVLLTMGVHAQRPAQERIKTLKVAFITERLGLTPSEAQDFWPVYNAHDEALRRLRRKERQRFGSQLPYLDDLTDDEAAKLLSEFQTLQNEKHGLEQEFLQNLEKVLPARKIVLLLKAEEDFKKRLLQQVRKRRGQ